MKRSVTDKLRYRSIALAVILALIGCLGITSLSAAEKAAPTELNIAIPCLTAVEQPWITSLIQALERVKAEKPHGLTINWNISENILPPDADRVLKQYAKSGEYGIILDHGTYPDVVKKLSQEYPDILWAFTGSGHKPLGGNGYWLDVYLHEPAYLCGIIAGMMSENNAIGAVASFPYPNVNLPINGFVSGAQSVSPDVKVKMTYLDSWWDPPKGKQSALAQIASGADFVYAERFGPFEACKEKGKLAFGHFVDQYSLAPEVVIASPIARWDPALNTIIDAWWDHETKGTPYNAPMERIVFFMKDGGSELSSYHGNADKIPQKVKDAVSKAKADIMSGKLTVPFKEGQVLAN